MSRPPGRLRRAVGRLLGPLRRTTAPPRRSAPSRAARPGAARPGAARPGARHVRLRDVHLSYDPSPDGDADPGEVVWTWVPYEDDPSQGKDRPVLVIGHCDGELAVVPFTSKRHQDRDDELEVGSGAWDRSGRPSMVKLDRILLVASHQVRREGATLDRRRFDRVVTALQDYDRSH